MNEEDRRLDDAIDRAMLMLSVVGTDRGRQEWAERLEKLVEIRSQRRRELLLRGVELEA